MSRIRVLTALAVALAVAGVLVARVDATTCGWCYALRYQLGADDPVIDVMTVMDIPSDPCVIWGDAYDHIGLRTNYNDIMEIGILHSTDNTGPTLYTRCTWCTSGLNPQKEVENHGTWEGGLNNPVILVISYDDVNRIWT